MYGCSMFSSPVSPCTNTLDDWYFACASPVYPLPLLHGDVMFTMYAHSDFSAQSDLPMLQIDQKRLRSDTDEGEGRSINVSLFYFLEN